MNFEALFLFLILLLGLLLCSFLGGKCSKEGFSSNDTITTQLVNGSVFTGSNGGTIKVNISSDGTKTLDVTKNGTEKPVSFTTDNKTNISPDGVMFMIFVSPDKKSTVVFSVEPKNGNISALLQPPNLSTSDSNDNLLTSKIIYTLTSIPTTSNNFDNYNHFSNNNDSDNENDSNTKYFGSTGLSIPPSEISSTYDYSSSLPPGIPKSQIVSGKEDLYILKTQVVPPVCPACPGCPACPMCPASTPSSNKYEITNKYETSNNNTAYKTQAYPLEPQNPLKPQNPRELQNPREPQHNSEPAGYFDNKKASNYSNINNSYLPVPVLADFSTFGM